MRRMRSSASPSSRPRCRCSAAVAAARRATRCCAAMRSTTTSAGARARAASSTSCLLRHGSSRPTSSDAGAPRLRSGAEAKDAEEDDRAEREARRRPVRVGDAEQRDGGVGAARPRLEDVGQQPIERRRADDAVGEGEVARLRLRRDKLLPECRGDAGEREQEGERSRDAAARGAAPDEAEQREHGDRAEDEALQDAPRAGLHVVDVLRDERSDERAERDDGDEREQRRRASAAARACPHSPTWAISSISTQAPRACAPFSAKTSPKSSEQPLVTRWCSVKSGALLTRLVMRTMRSILSRSPTAAWSVPSRSIATARAAFLPVDVFMSRPSWPTQALPSRLAMCPERKTRLPVRTKGT